jgi:uncharacterized protein (DUF362 family)
MALPTVPEASSVDDVLVDEICGDVRVLLAEWEREYAGRPDALVRKLWLLALEREQIVVVAYKDETVVRRVNELDVPDDLRAVIRQTLAWIWKDEEMHVDYARSRLVRLRHPVPTAVVFGRQLVGAASGWISATSNHSTVKDNPVQALLARSVVTVARVTRRVPARLAKELSHQTFRGYSALNVALEESAALGYELLIKHVTDPAEAEAVRRIAADERRHQQSFRVLAAALDDHGRLREGVRTHDVIDQLARISPFHLPAETREGVDVERTMARPDRRVVRSRQAAGDKSDLDGVFWPMLDGLRLHEAVRADPTGRVVIKGAFMLGYHRRDRSNVGSPEVIDSLARYVRQHGATDVVLIEAPTIYDRYYANRSVHEVAEYFGFSSPNYRIADASADQVPVVFDRGLAQHTVSATWIQASLRLVVGKLRGDPAEIAHSCLSTMQGMGSRSDTVIHIDREIDFRTAVMMVLDVAPPDFGIIEAWGECADGPLGLMGCRTPVGLSRLWASRNIVALDAAVVADIGEDPANAVILRRARDWFGVDISAPTNDVVPVSATFRRRKATLFGRFICATAYPMYIFGSGRGSFFVPEMDETAFPQIGHTPIAIRAIRKASQVVFGIRPRRR